MVMKVSSDFRIGIKFADIEMSRCSPLLVASPFVARLGGIRPPPSGVQRECRRDYESAIAEDDQVLEYRQLKCPHRLPMREDPTDTHGNG